MRSYFCRKCDLEFDLEEEEKISPSSGEGVCSLKTEEEYETPVFCPKCLVTIAEALPETPERILARERRIRRQYQRAQRRTFGLILLYGFITALVTATMTVTYDSFWWMLVLGLIAGALAGVWTRAVTTDRSFRAGVLSLLILGILLAFCVLVPWSCGRFVFTEAARNLAAGGVLSWIIAVY